MSHLSPIWKNNDTIYVSEANIIKEIYVVSGKPKIIKTINTKNEPLLFYGVIDEQPLLLLHNTLMYGDTPLISLVSSRRYGIIWTGEYIFISETPSSLLIYDAKGNKICQTNPGRLIRFGSIGEDTSTVYGVSGSTLLRLSVKDNSIHIDEICDLSRY